MTPSLNSMKDWGTRKGYDFESNEELLELFSDFNVKLEIDPTQKNGFGLEVKYKCLSQTWLEKKIMCGLCNFGCCNHNSFHVEITEEEQEKYRKKFGLDLELEWSQDGCCDLLSDDGSGFVLWVMRDLYFVRCIL